MKAKMRRNMMLVLAAVVIIPLFVLGSGLAGRTAPPLRKEAWWTVTTYFEDGSEPVVRAEARSIFDVVEQAVFQTEGESKAIANITYRLETDFEPDELILTYEHYFDYRKTYVDAGVVTINPSSFEISITGDDIEGSLPDGEFVLILDAEATFTENGKTYVADFAEIKYPFDISTPPEATASNATSTGDVDGGSTQVYSPPPVVDEPEPDAPAMTAKTPVLDDPRYVCGGANCVNVCVYDYADGSTQIGYC